jgi:predicted kinase
MVNNIVIVAGNAGSGKTELAKQLSVRTGWPLLDKDTLTRPFVEEMTRRLTADPHDRHSTQYLEQVRPLEYEVLLATMWEVLAFGPTGVVVTAPFVKELLDSHWLDDVNFQCEIHDYRLTIVWLHCDPETLRDRIVARGAARDRWKLLNWVQWVSSLTEPQLRKQDLRVDNSAQSTAALSFSVEQIAGRLLHD